MKKRIVEQVNLPACYLSIGIIFQHKAGVIRNRHPLSQQDLPFSSCSTLSPQHGKSGFWLHRVIGQSPLWRPQKVILKKNWYWLRKGGNTFYYCKQHFCTVGLHWRIFGKIDVWIWVSHVTNTWPHVTGVLTWAYALCDDREHLFEKHVRLHRNTVVYKHTYKEHLFQHKYTPKLLCIHTIPSTQCSDTMP
jgi:hypothetical protein